MGEQRRPEQLFTEGDVITGKVSKEAYYEQRRRQALSGAPTWMLRNFEGETGRVMDFYAGRPIGFVSEDFGSGHCEMYVHTQDGKLVLLDDAQTFAEAKERLEQFSQAAQSTSTTNEQ